ncbi:MAG: type III secretion protein [Nitrospirae bacterium]|nr:MAG: type III secretion protein [Nitrospirota bacterium]
MLEQIGIKNNELVAFLMVLLRVSIVLVVLPVFGSKSFPAQFRIGLILTLSLALTPFVEVRADVDDIAMLVVRETLFSITLALMVRVLFFAIDTAGQAISTATGMSMANVFNPEIGQSTEISRFYSIIAIFLFFALDMHHYFIYALAKSFHFVPVGTADIGSIVKTGISLGEKIFVLAVKLSAPAITIVLITNILLGILYKLIPQFNIFFVAYPLYLALGFLIILLTIPMVVVLINGYFSDMKSGLNNLLFTGGMR